MKVWVITYVDDYDERFLACVVDSAEKADGYARRYGYDVEEIEVT